MEAIALGAAALDVLEPDSPGWAPIAGNQAALLSMRYMQTGDPGDLDASIALGEAALALQPDSPDRILLARAQAARRWERYDIAGDEADLGAFIMLAEQSWAAQAEGWPGTEGACARHPPGGSHPSDSVG